MPETLSQPDDGETDTHVKLGQQVRDKISGYEGIVIGIAEHLTGCTRIGVRPHSDKSSLRGEEEWFYDAQLEVIDADTEFARDGEQAVTTVPFQLGDCVADDVTGVEGIASTITYELYNCPRAAVTPISDDETEAVDREWFDVPRLDVVDSGVREDYTELVGSDEVAATGAGPEDIQRKDPR